MINFIFHRQSVYFVGVKSIVAFFRNIKREQSWKIAMMHTTNKWDRQKCGRLASLIKNEFHKNSMKWNRSFYALCSFYKGATTFFSCYKFVTCLFVIFCSVFFFFSSCNFFSFGFNLQEHRFLAKRDHRDHGKASYSEHACVHSDHLFCCHCSWRHARGFVQKKEKK